MKKSEFFRNLKAILKKGLEVGDNDYVNKNDIKSNTRFLVPDLTHEDEENMTNRIAEKIKKMNMELPAIIFLETIKPVNRLISQLYGFYAAPFFEIFGLRGYTYSIYFNKRENLERLISKLKNKD